MSDIAKNKVRHAHAGGNYNPPGWFKRGFGRLIFKWLGGWQIEGAPPTVDKCIIVVAHHTSNWDFAVGVGCKFMLGMQVRFFAKRSLFFPPLGWIMRHLGGVAIERSKAYNRVELFAEEIRRADHFMLCITPEGTRSKVQRWKTGFYHIARKADIPVVLTALDFERRRLVFDEPIYLCGDQEKDFEMMHRFFLPYKPKYPERAYNGSLK